jgi:TolB-like protein
MGAEEVLRLGRQMADALAHAHDNGVVHRDFKSANVVITSEGRAKVLDFGLAARVSDTELSEATTYSVDSLELSGKIVGTLAYMAPEQLRGEAADACSDIWALGIVLYEMASGVRPFKGKTGFELSSAILSATPEPLPSGRGGVMPAQLQIVIDRCLEKDPARRYQSAGELRAALETAQSAATGPLRSVAWPARPGRRWLLPATGLAVVLAVMTVLDVGGVRRLLVGGGGGQVRAVRMAVLPFANLSGDPEQEYLSDGFTQEMITQLGRLHPEGLSVIARTSVMRYKKGDTPIDQIGRELGVDYVLEGSTQREADRVRISAELIDVGYQTQLWADSFEKEFSGILSVQREVALEVAEALALELLPTEQVRLASSARTVDPEAYEAYLKGSYYWKKLTPESIDTAQRYFELALEKDETYAPAYSGISLVWMARATATVAAALPHEAAPKARAAADKSLELDSTLAEPHFALAGIATWYEWDWDTAEREFRLALDLNPNFADGHVFYGLFLTAMGRLDEARAQIRKGVELDPHNFMYQTYLGIAFERSRRSRCPQELVPSEGDV